MFKRSAISRKGDTTVSCEWANIGFDFSIRARSESVGACGVVFDVPPTVTETGVLECPTTIRNVNHLVFLEHFTDFYVKRNLCSSKITVTPHKN
jgi:hypothetical protein